MPALMGLLLLYVLLWVLPGRARRIARGMTMFLLCAILVPVLLLLDSAAWTLRFTLLDPAFYLKGFREVGMYEAIPGALAKVLPEATGGPGAAPGDQSGMGMIGALASRAVTPAWLEREVSRAVEGLVGYVSGSKPTLDLRVDLKDPKARVAEFLAAEGGRNAGELQQAMATIPDEVTGNTLFPASELEQALGAVRANVRILVLAGPVLLGVAAVLALIAWLVSGGGRGARVWLGAGLVTVGSAVVILGLVAVPMVFQFAAGVNLSPQFAGVPFRAWLETSATRLLRLWQTMGASALAVGTVLIVVRRLPRRKDAPSGAGTTA